MNKIIKVAVLIATMSTFVVGCNKEEDNVLTSSTPSSEMKSGTSRGFSLGKKLDNPYTVQNMRKAQDSLLRIGELTRPVDIQTTHLYVQMLPQDSADLNKIIDDSTLLLFPYPLDYEVEGEGSFEIQEGETPEVYTVVPVGYNIPINHRVIDECYIPTNYDDPDVVTLEIGSFVRTGNATKEELKDLSLYKSIWKHPKGYVRVYNTATGQNEGVRRVHVYTRRLVNIACAYTNDNGYYSISRGYLFNPNYSVVFENSNGFKIWGNIGPLTPAIHNVGTHSREGYDITIGHSSQAWPWATINNAALLYRTTFVPHFGVSNTPSNMRFWYINKKSNLGSASTPMLRHVSGYASSQVAKWLQIFGVSSTTSYIIGGALYCALQFCPDILVMKDTDTKSLHLTIFHEMAHATHYSKAGSAYWLTYIGQICVNMGYGNNYNSTNGVIGVGEMWGDYFGKKCYNYYYNPDLSYSNGFWFKPGILGDIDNNLNDIGPSLIHYVMRNTVTNPGRFKTALINQWGHSSVITQCFNAYGF